MKATAAEETTEQLTSTERVKRFVSLKVGALQSEISAGRRARPDQVAALARLRRGVNKDPGELLDLLEFVIDPAAPEPRGDDVTWSEQAIYTAVTLYALHQQSQGQPMHVAGRSFAEAVSTIRFQGGEEVRGVTRRFQAAATSQDLDELVHHCRGLIAMLRSRGQGFDYAQFAVDLFRYQDPRRANDVRLAWGRDYYRATSQTEEDK